MKKESPTCDVDGLCDEQTIHLDPQPNGSSSPSSGNDGSSSGGDNPESLGVAAGSTSGSCGALLLAALLGLGGGFSLGSTDDDNNDNGGDTTTNNPTSEVGRFASLGGGHSQQQGVQGIYTALVLQRHIYKCLVLVHSNPCIRVCSFYISQCTTLNSHYHDGHKAPTTMQHH
eukprot:13900321-Ditylum_brightwellii.AAC.1